MCSWIDVNLLFPIFTFFPVRCEMPKLAQIRTLKWRLVLPIQVQLQLPHFIPQLILEDVKTFDSNR